MPVKGSKYQYRKKRYYLRDIRKDTWERIRSFAPKIGIYNSRQSHSRFLDHILDVVEENPELFHISKERREKAIVEYLRNGK